MTDVVDFLERAAQRRAQREPQEPDWQLIHLCSGCGTNVFKLVDGGAIKCAGCDVVINRTHQRLPGSPRTPAA
jgi:hypothetical protein